MSEKINASNVNHNVNSMEKEWEEVMEWERIEMEELESLPEKLPPAKVVLNEQHSLLPEQEQLLEGYDYKILKVPAQGWNREEMDEIISSLKDYDGLVIFASPVPYLLAQLAYRAGGDHSSPDVAIFFNPNREKKELPNGKIIFTIPKTGWELVEIG